MGSEMGVVSQVTEQKIGGSPPRFQKHRILVAAVGSAPSVQNHPGIKGCWSLFFQGADPTSLHGTRCHLDGDLPASHFERSAKSGLAVIAGSELQ